MGLGKVEYSACMKDSSMETRKVDKLGRAMVGVWGKLLGFQMGMLKGDQMADKTE
jgi:hypothetical protein